MSKRRYARRPRPRQSPAQFILDTWERIEDSDPDISTERLLALVSDICGVEVDDVVDVLAIHYTNGLPG